MSDDGRGRPGYYEDFTAGEIIYHPWGRTIGAGDNQWFALMTQNVSASHFDEFYARQAGFPQTVVAPTYLFALVAGQSTVDLSAHVAGSLGWDSVRIPAPVHPGDTIYSRSKILSKRISKSRPGTGVVTAATEGFNQRGEVVISFTRAFLMYRRGSGPTIDLPRPDESSLPDADLDRATG